MTGRVLLVDDTPLSLKLIKIRLEQEYYTVFTAAGGQEAMNLVVQLQPDVVIVDAIMPDIDGLAMTRIIKNDPKVSHIPVIIVTALNTQREKVKSLLAGADEFLSKPIDNDILLAKLGSLLQLKFLADALRVREKASGGIVHTPGTYALDNEAIIKISQILFVDDDLERAELYHKILTSLGLNVDIHVHPRSALDSFLSKQYNLCIVNTSMNFDSLTLCSGIKNDSRLRYIPVLLIMASQKREMLTKAFGIGVYDCLILPIDKGELFARCIGQIKRYCYYKALQENHANSLIDSVTDPLTQLYNKRYLENYLNVVMRERQKTSKILFVLDLDDFKQINDTYGHVAGDVVIQKVAKILSSGIRIIDLCARFGGEEFVIILSDVSVSAAAVIAEKLRSLIANEIFVVNVAPAKTSEVRCTCSIGGTQTLDSDNMESVLQRADANMYAAKKLGKNHIIIV
ncbi:two-component system, cell cycle response regulator [Alphaproteobacteria bacterium]